MGQNTPNHDTDRLSAVKQALLKKRLSGLVSHEQAAAGSAAVIGKAEYNDIAPLTSAQQRLWYIYQMEPESPVYNISLRYRVSGRLDGKQLQLALSEIAARHESLRTVIEINNGIPCQRILPAPRVTFSEADVGTGDGESLRGLLGRESKSTFDLGAAPPWRVLVIRQAAERHILSMVFHHIIHDSLSLNTLMEELEALYSAFCAGQPSPLAPLHLQYADYAVWEADWLAGEQASKQLAYWVEQFEGELTPLQLPSDYPRPAQQSFAGAAETEHLPANFVRQLETLSRRENATLFMLLLTAFYTLLYRYSGEKDIVVGMPVAGRPHRELEKVFGVFANTLAMPLNMDGNPSFLDLLARVRDQCLTAFTHQELPFNELVREVRPPRDLSRTPLYQAFIAFENQLNRECIWGTLALELLPNEVVAAQTDVSLWLKAAGNGIHATLEYCSALFSQQTMRRMLDHYRQLLHSVVADPTARIDQINFLSSAEQQQLVAFNPARSAYEREQLLPFRLTARVARQPDTVAVIAGRKSLSYAEMERYSNQLAHYLRSLGAEPGVLVGICVERSIEMLVSLLGIWKAGAAYVPLDPQYPAARLRYMLDTAAVTLLVTQTSLQQTLPDYACRRVCIDSEWDAITAQPESKPAVRVGPEDLAYVIFTSGSTGQPKGVQVPHGALQNFLHSMAQEPGLDSQDKLLAVTTLSFDIAALELFLPLFVGATTVIADEHAVQDGKLLAALIDKHKANVMQATPSTWRLLLLAGWEGSSQFKILCGGEALPRDLAPLLFNIAGEVWNMYGPTETTVWSTCYRIRNAQQILPVGKPIANTQCYVLDASQQLAPLGVPGELYISGDGVALGYINEPVLTAQRFITHPLQPAGKLYRTGDLVRWREGGVLDYLQRVDNQVKIRGFRIELEEVETVLARHAGVAQNVVIVREDQPADQRLVAYVVLKPGGELTITEMRKHMRELLPDYMIPRHLLEITALPLTPNGKIDKKSLPPPGGASVTANSYEAPATASEHYLADTWAELIDIEQVGAYDNFFDLGGHSLLAARMAIRVEQETDIIVPLNAILLQSLRQIAGQYFPAEWHMKDSESTELQLGPTTVLPDKSRFSLFDVFKRENSKEP